jgi:hypothetical protein
MSYEHNDPRRAIYLRFLVQQILDEAPYEPSLFSSRIDGLLL